MFFHMLFQGFGHSFPVHCPEPKLRKKLGLRPPVAMSEREQIIDNLFPRDKRVFIVWKFHAVLCEVVKVLAGGNDDG